MDISLSWAGVGIIVAVFGHAFFTVWSAASFKATISTKLDNLVVAMNRLDKELEKRDLQISAAWKRIDDINGRLSRVESRTD